MSYNKNPRTRVWHIALSEFSDFIARPLTVTFLSLPPQALLHRPLCSSLRGVPALARWGNPSGSLPITSRCRFPRLMSITMISTSSLRNGLGGSTGKRIETIHYSLRLGCLKSIKCRNINVAFSFVFAGRWWTPWCGTSRCKSLETDSLVMTGRGTCTQHIHCQLGEIGCVYRAKFTNLFLLSKGILENRKKEKWILIIL